MRTLIKELNHVAVRTANMEETIRFYTGVLNAAIIRDTLSTDGKSRFVYLQLAQGVIELVPGMPGADNLGLQHVAFLLERGVTIDEACGVFKALGLRFTVEPKKAGSGDGYLAFFEDYSGALFEVIQREENIRIPNLVNEYIEAFDHIALSTVQSAACDAFYRETLSFEALRAFETPTQSSSFYRLGVDTLALLCPRGGAAPVPGRIDHITLRVNDCRAMRTRLESCGIVCGEPEPAPLGGYTILTARGPDGERIDFVDRPALESYSDVSRIPFPNL